MGPLPIILAVAIVMMVMRCVRGTNKVPSDRRATLIAPVQQWQLTKALVRMRDIMAYTFCCCDICKGRPILAWIFGALIGMLLTLVVMVRYFGDKILWQLIKT